MPKSSPILIFAVWAAVLVLSICRASAHDHLGQWDGVDPLHRQWFDELMRPDNPGTRCCGLADAYWADSYEVNGDQYAAGTGRFTSLDASWAIHLGIGGNAANCEEHLCTRGKCN